jgi:hypothetical protein
MIDGFTKPDKTIPDRFIISISGVGKAGKTSVALTAPPPIAYCDFNIRDRGVIEKFSNIELYRRKYVSSDFNKDSQNDCIIATDQFDEDFAKLLKSNDVESIVVDTMTDFIKMKKIADVGTLAVKPKLSYKWRDTYTYFDDLIRAAFDSNKNIVFIHEVRPEFVDNKWTGDYYRDSYSKMENRVEMELFLWTEVEKESLVSTNVEYRMQYVFDGRGKLRTGYIINDFDGGYCLEGGLPRVWADHLGGDPDDYNYTMME